jgi:plasmid maintenance system antidote protein VapI
LEAGEVTQSQADGKIINPHPGEILLDEFLEPMGLSQNKFRELNLMREKNL